MQISFLIGNGFDISLGLQSSYASFNKWYCNLDTDKKHIRDFRKEIKDDIENGGKNWSDFERALGKYTKNFTIETVDQFIDCYEDAHQSLLKFLETEKSKFDFNISEECISLFRNSLLRYYDELTPRDKKTIEKECPQDRQSTRFKFISFNYTNCLDLFVADSSNTPLKQWKYGATPLSISVDPIVTHVHGMIEQFPVFGVNDESQISNKDLLSNAQFKRIMIKPTCVEEIGQLWHDEAKSEIEKSHIICVFGMSIGETDAIWFERIMNWLQADNNRHLIVYWHTDDPANSQSIVRWTQNQRKVQVKLTDYTALSNEQIDNLNKRIHVVENTKIVFPMKLQFNANYLKQREKENITEAVNKIQVAKA